MTDERIESLNELDFEWSNRTSSASSVSWEVRLQELTMYKQANGSTNVPQHHPPNQPLANWVKTQRTQYKLLKRGKMSAMTAEHIKSLNELDFEWSTGITLCCWEDRFQELTMYKQANGSTNVPHHHPPNQPLANWVKTQRTQYKLLKRGRKSAMTAEHIKSLNELDFEWGTGITLGS
jgi:hypothetical protein